MNSVFERNQTIDRKPSTKSRVRRNFLLGCIAFAPIFLGACIDGMRTFPVSEGMVAKFQDCAQDSDCVYVQNGCCDCANGGSEAWINKKYVGEFSKLFNCSGAPCTLKARIRPCGEGQPKCSRGRCKGPDL